MNLTGKPQWDKLSGVVGELTSGLSLCCHGTGAESGGFRGGGLGMGAGGDLVLYFLSPVQEWSHWRASCLSRGGWALSRPVAVGRL
jgi:hypothetical protein